MFIKNDQEICILKNISFLFHISFLNIHIIINE